MLSIVYRGIGFPVVWLPLPKTGNSDTIERETLIEIFIDLFGAQNIQCLLGDREFVGKRWFRFLRQHRIKFRMRLKKDTPVCNSRGKLVHAWRLFTSTRVNQMLVLPEARQMWGMELYLSGCYLGSGEYLIPVSAEHSPEPHREYKERWGIETLFALTRQGTLGCWHFARNRVRRPIPLRKKVCESAFESLRKEILPNEKIIFT